MDEVERIVVVLSGQAISSEKRKDRSKIGAPYSPQ